MFKTLEEVMETQPYSFSLDGWSDSTMKVYDINLTYWNKRINFPIQNLYKVEYLFNETG
jgi:hypothetical protein